MSTNPDIFAFDPPGWDPYWTVPGGGGYLLYVGADAGGIDFSAPVASAPPGGARISLAPCGLAWDTPWYFGLRAMSDSGVEETNVDCVCSAMIHAGALVEPAPNAIDGAGSFAFASLVGTLGIAYAYNATGSPSTAVAIQAAIVAGGTPDWAAPLTPLAPSTLAIAARRTVIFSRVFSDRQTVQLAVRTVTASGTPSEPVLLAPVSADNATPPAPPWAEVSQL